MSARRAAAVVSGVAGVAATLVLAGCGSQDVVGRVQSAPTSSPSSTSAAPSPVTSSSGADSASPSASSTDQAVVDVLGMRVSDFQPGYRLEEPTGSSSLDVGSLDHCGASYPSEADRTARRALVLVAPDGVRMNVLSEAVTYSSPAAAAKALQELSAAVAACPDGTSVSVGGNPAVLRPDDPATIPTKGLVPEADRVLVGTRYESPDGTVVLRTLALWQRSGRGVVELLLTHTDAPFTDADLARLGGLGAKIAAHLEEQADVLG